MIYFSRGGRAVDSGAICCPERVACTAAFDPSFVVSHGLPLEDAPKAFALFRNKESECTKVVLKPGLGKAARPAGDARPS